MAHEIIGDPVTLPDGTKLPLSQAIRAGDFVLLSGQLGLAPGTGLVGDDVSSQTHQCIKNIAAVLEQAGCSLDNVVKATVWLTDVSDFPAFNAVYNEYFGERPPVRSTVRSVLVLPGAKVEIEGMAYAG